MSTLLEVTLVKWQRLVDLFRCTVSDLMHRQHTVEIPISVLQVEPTIYKRGTDAEHIGIVAAGAVLMNNDPEVRFHKVDRSMVNRAYEAASKAQILGRFGKH